MKLTKITSTETFEVKGRGTLYTVPADPNLKLEPGQRIILNDREFTIRAVEHSGSDRAISGTFRHPTIGDHFIVKIKAGTLGVVRLSRNGPKPGSYHAINLSTGRELYLRSSRRLRREATPTEINRAKVARIRPPKVSIGGPPGSVSIGAPAPRPQTELQHITTVYRSLYNVVVEVLRQADSDLTDLDRRQAIVTLIIDLNTKVAAALRSAVRLSQCGGRPSPIDPPPAKCPKCGHSEHNQNDCIRCTCDHQKGIPLAPKPATYPSEKAVSVGPCYSEEEWSAKRRTFEEAEKKAEEEAAEEDGRYPEWD